MSKIKNRGKAPTGRQTVDERLARLLDTPFLTRVAPHLPPETLHRLIQSRGLDACVEVVASATPAQLTSLLDLELWPHPRAGGDERFDVERFGEWLEVLVDADPSTAARTVAALDENTVVAGLSRLVRVFDPVIFEPVAQSDDEPAERHEAMREGDTIGAGDLPDRASIPAEAPADDCAGDRLEFEVGGYIVRARRSFAWNAIIALLLALEAEHWNYFRAVMQGCRRLSNSRPEVDGLDDVLGVPEQHLHDITIERERRRSQQGYATAGDARAFLQMARRSARTPYLSGAATSPIAAAYLRAVDDAAERSHPQSVAPAVRIEGNDAPASIAAVIDLLREAGLMPGQPLALAAGADAGPDPGSPAILRRLMIGVREADE